MKVFEIMAFNTAERISAFMVKYAEFLKALASSKGADVGELDEVISALKGKFKEVLKERLKEKYHPLYNDGLEYFRPERATVTILGGDTYDGNMTDLSFIKSCLDESGIDRDVLDLGVLKGVRVQVEISKVLPDTELNVINVGKSVLNPETQESLFESETVFFENGGARFSGEKVGLSVEDAMASAVRIATSYHKDYVNGLYASVERLKEKRDERALAIKSVLSMINEYREDAKVVPSYLYREEEWAEAEIEYTNDKLARLEDYLSSLDRAADVEFEGGKYAYKFLKDKGSSEPGDED